MITILDLDLAAMDIRRAMAIGLHEYLDTLQARLIEIDRALANDIFRALPESV